MFHVVELSKQGIISEGVFKTRKEAEERKEELVSMWTHWDKPEMPCQKQFDVIEQA